MGQNKVNLSGIPSLDKEKTEKTGSLFVECVISIFVGMNIACIAS